MTVTEIRQESLSRATQGTAWSNYADIYKGFLEKGILEADIEPRVNVFTFNAWRALGRHVKKGEHGVRITTWIPMRGKEDGGTESGGEKKEEKRNGLRPKTAVVFHVSQTEKD